MGRRSPSQKVSAKKKKILSPSLRPATRLGIQATQRQQTPQGDTIARLGSGEIHRQHASGFPCPVAAAVAVMRWRTRQRRPGKKTRRTRPSRGGWRLKRDSHEVQMGVHARKSFGHQAGRGDAAADGDERAKNQAAAAAAVRRPETHLKTGSGRVALLLLGSLGARLTAGALPSRRLALASGHCERRIDAGRRLKMLRDSS